MYAQGIIFGLLAATCQSLCYVFSRRFVAKPGGRGTTLFAMSHVQMGVIALLVLPFCWSDRALDVATYILPLLGAVGSYLLAQFFLFQAFKHTDPSRVSPLLGLKVLILSLIAVTFLRERVTLWQWVAVLISVIAALGLNYSGGGVPLKAIATILLTCVGYSLSDLSIVSLTKALAPDGSFRMILLGVCLSYVLAGLVGLAMVVTADRDQRTPEQFRRALPVAIVWFAAMVCLFVCFRSIGALFGNIVQSLRGPLSILIGMAVASLGHVHLEKKVGAWILARRIIASLLMCGAVALFAYEKARVQKAEQAPASEPPLTVGLIAE